MAVWLLLALGAAPTLRVEASSACAPGASRRWNDVLEEGAHDAAGDQ
jgi:hypothetical protein